MNKPVSGSVELIETEDETRATGPIVVTKAGDEGSILVNRRSGVVETPSSVRPEWADGLAVAQLAERQGFYEGRLGKQVAASFASPDMIDYEDLDWIGMDAENEEVHVEADANFRAAILTEKLGLDDEGNVDDSVNLQLTAEMEGNPGIDAETLAELEDENFTESQKSGVAVGE